MIWPTPAHRQPGAIVPRSASLALWLWDTTDDPRAVRDALRVVVDDDEPHTLRGDVPEGLPGDLGTPTLAALLTLWAGRVTAVTALFPGPGDAMSAPAPVSARAIEAEECVLVTVAAAQAPGARRSPDERASSDEHWALVPDVERFGSELEPGHLVVWDVVRIDPWQARAVGTVGTLAEAQRQLQAGLREATEALVELDVSRWRDEAADAIAALRDPVDLRALLPDGLDPRRVQVFQSAARLRAIVDLATVDDGGAVTVWQADQRATALREVDRGARRAMSAATLHVPLD